MVDPGAAAVVMGRRGWAVFSLHSRFHPVLLCAGKVVISSIPPYAIRTPTFSSIWALIGIDVIKFTVSGRDRK